MRKIQKTICREELKSRIPALFAYIEENDAGEFKLHTATDSLQGCYGKIVENITLPKGFALSIKEGEDTKSLLKDEETYSYRTLMNYYYEYKDYDFTDEDNSTFIDFIVRAIGKVKIDTENKYKDCDMVPDYIYLANARRLFHQYSKMKMMYDYYTGGDDEFDINILEKDACCLCSKYRRMGGTEMYNELNDTLIPMAESIAKEYRSYVAEEEADGEKTARWDLCNTSEDLNIKLYNRCSIHIPLNFTQSINDIGYLSCYLNEWVGGDVHKEGELYTYNGSTYICNEEIDVYDDKTMSFVFDDKTHFTKINEADTSLTYCHLTGGKFAFYNEDGSEINKSEYPLDGFSDSKLKSLRKYNDYLNGRDIQETPADGEDWLYYYRKDAVINYTTVNDDYGNIISASAPYDDKGKLNPAKAVNDLMAYGNVITDITANSSEKTITFEYYINAHLKAKNIHIDTDDDGNKLYKFDGFYIDTEDKYHGVKYTETYSYEEGGELDGLVNGNGNDGFTFETYVEDIDGNVTSFKKFAFRLSDSYAYYDKRTDTQIVTIPYIKSRFDANINNKVDYLFADVFKADYLNGITYKPTVENDVRIERGNYAAFEKHIKLGEVKSMEAMENFSNGSFFNMQKSN